jgi:hypothetical protein
VKAWVLFFYFLILWDGLAVTRAAELRTEPISQDIMANNISFEAIEGRFVARKEFRDGEVRITGRMVSKTSARIDRQLTLPYVGDEEGWVEFIRVKNPEELGLLVLLQIIKE